MTAADHPRRRWFRFSLRTLFLVMTLGSVIAWLSPDMWLVYQRRTMWNWITERGGKVYLLSDEEEATGWYLPRPTIPWIRKCMGDKAVYSILVPYKSTKSDIEHLQAIFPEANAIGPVG